MGMEVHECEDAVHAALKQRRPKLIVDIINKVPPVFTCCLFHVRSKLLWRGLHVQLRAVC